MPPSNPTKDPIESLPLNSDPGQIQVGAPVPPHLTIHGHQSNYYDLPLDLTGMMNGGPSELNLTGMMNSGPSGMNYLEPIVTGPSLNMGSSFDILQSIESFSGTSESASADPASTSRSTVQTRTLRIGKAITAR